MATADPTWHAEQLRLRRLLHERRAAFRAAALGLRRPLRANLQAVRLLPRLLPEIGAALLAVLLLHQLQQRRYRGLWLLSGALDLWRLYRLLQAKRTAPVLPPPAAGP